MSRDVGDDVVIADQMRRVVFAPPEGGDQIESMLQELVGWVERRSTETQAIIDTESRYAPRGLHRWGRSSAVRDNPSLQRRQRTHRSFLR